MAGTNLEIGTEGGQNAFVRRERLVAHSDGDVTEGGVAAQLVQPLEHLTSRSMTSYRITRGQNARGDANREWHSVTRINIDDVLSNYTEFSKSHSDTKQ